MSLHDAVSDSIRVHAAPAPGEAVLALVSGGPDSMAMMHALASVHGGRIEVLTIDHGLRDAAARECALVQREAGRLGLIAHRRELGLRAGPGVQARAREARYRAARELAAERGLSAIAAGHTRDDQAETVLMRMARGAGSAGASAMARRAGMLVRPLLDVGADETRRWCATHAVCVAEDPSNRDAGFTRVHVRELLRGLEARMPGATGHIAALADDLREEADLLALLADSAMARCAGPAGCSLAALSQEPYPIRKRVLRQLLVDAGAKPDRVDRAGLRRVLGVAEGDSSATQVAGVRVARARGYLHVGRGAAAPAPQAALLRVPGETLFGGARLTASVGPAPQPSPHRVGLVVDDPRLLRVRGPRAGDRIPLAGGGRARVGRLLAQRGVAAEGRCGVPVVVDGDVPVWVAGHRADPGRLARPGQPALVMEVSPA